MTKRPEKDDELCARYWLRQQGHRDIRQPGSDPPDFVVDGDCAVEVTRLNQRIVVGDDKRSKGEEEARKPLADHLENLFEKLGPPGNQGRSWVIDCEYDFTEPLPHPKVVAAQISEALAPLLIPCDDSVISGMHSRHLDYSKHAGEISYSEMFREPLVATAPNQTWSWDITKLLLARQTATCIQPLLADLGVLNSRYPEVPPRLPWPLPRSPPRFGTTPNIAMAGSRCSITIEPRACWSSAGGPIAATRQAFSRDSTAQ